jgi:hypothetical protein
MKYAMVPVEDIEKLEEARKLLFALTESIFIADAFIMPISQPMFEITHKRHQIIEGPR